MVARSPICASNQHRSKKGVHNECAADIGGQRGNIIRHIVDFADFVSSEGIDVFAYQGWQLPQLTDVTTLKQNVLIGKKLIISVGDQVLTSSQRERWEPSLVIRECSAAERREEHRRRLAQGLEKENLGFG